MATTNHDRVGKALELLRTGLAPFIERELKSAYQDKAKFQAAALLGEDRLNAKKPITEWDASALLKVTWDSWNDAAGRYRGLRGGQAVAVDEGDTGLLVRSEVARRQLDAERPQASAQVSTGAGASPRGTTDDSAGSTQPAGAAAPVQPRRYHGTVTLDPARVGRDASKVADEVITHLVGLVGSSVTVTLEIQAQVASGVPDNVVRTVMEKFVSQGFEKE